MTAWLTAVLALGTAAAWWDWRHRTIPRALTVPAAAAGLTYHAVAGGFDGALLAMLLGLGLGLALMQVRAFGGGDAKWMAALGALLGLHLWLWTLEFGLLAAGLGALAQLAWRGRLLFLFADLGAIWHGWRRHGWQSNPEHSLDSPGAVTAPFGVSIGLGLLAAILLHP